MNNSKPVSNNLDYYKSLADAKEEYKKAPQDSPAQLAAMKKINNLIQNNPSCKKN